MFHRNPKWISLSWYTCYYIYILINPNPDTVLKSDTTSAATIDRRHAMQLHIRIDELLSSVRALVSHRVLKQPP